MLNARITKHFHRNLDTNVVGDLVHEQMSFISRDEMEKFGEYINTNHTIFPYSITNAYVDDKNFICFDLTEIVMNYGWIDYCDVDRSGSVSDQVLTEIKDEVSNIFATIYSKKKKS